MLLSVLLLSYYIDDTSDDISLIVVYGLCIRKLSFEWTIHLLERILFYFPSRVEADSHYPRLGVGRQGARQSFVKTFSGAFVSGDVHGIRHISIISIERKNYVTEN